MKSLNIYFLTQIENEECFSEYESALSQSHELRIVKPHEQASLRALVSHLSDKPMSLEYYDGFFLSFVINHISKEFDLLKIASDHSMVLNIELKSQDIGDGRITRQLVQNRYYLRHISANILSYTYVLSTDTLYRLNEHSILEKCSFDILRENMTRFADFVPDNIDDLFRAEDFLISPGNTPEKFLSHSYFLTTQQNDFKTQIIQYIKPCLSPSSAGPVFLSLTGSPGTGKTLLLYDIAAEMSSETRIVIVHCGPMSSGIRYLNEHMENVSIIPSEVLSKAGSDIKAQSGINAGSDIKTQSGIKAGSGIKAQSGINAGSDIKAQSDIKAGSGIKAQSGINAGSGIKAQSGINTGQNERLILVDEAGRLSSSQFETIQRYIRRHNAACIFSFDSKQILYAAKQNRQTVLRIQSISSDVLKLSDRIRANKELASFIISLFDLKRKTGIYDYGCVDVIYASRSEDTAMFTEYYIRKGFVYIKTENDYTAATSGSGSITDNNDCTSAASAEKSSYPGASYPGHIFSPAQVIGQEFDCVAMVIDSRFYFNENGRLCANDDPFPQTPLLEMLFQGVSRARERLALIISRDEELFEKINSIKLHV